MFTQLASDMHFLFRSTGRNKARIATFGFGAMIYLMVLCKKKYGFLIIGQKMQQTSLLL